MFYLNLCIDLSILYINLFKDFFQVLIQICCLKEMISAPVTVYDKNNPLTVYETIEVTDRDSTSLLWTTSSVLAL